MSKVRYDPLLFGNISVRPRCKHEHITFYYNDVHFKTIYTCLDCETSVTVTDFYRPKNQEEFNYLFEVTNVSRYT